jgi:hypothetical protein
MAHNIHHTRLAGYVLLGSLIISVCGVSTASAAEDIIGGWKVTMDFNGMSMLATLTIAKKADGSLTGKWGSTGDLQNVKFEGDNLTFSRTMDFGGQAFTQDFKGSLKDGKITGTMGNDQFSSGITAVRKKPLSPAIGQWDLTFKSGNQETTARLIANQKADGSLTGEWTKAPGQNTVSNVKFQDGKLTFTLKSEAESTFEGSVKGDELTGNLKTSAGTLPISGKRFGTALIGTWQLTSNAEGPFGTGALVVDPNLGGIYELFITEIPLKSLKLEGDQVTFAAEIQFGDQPMTFEFKGKLDGKTLKGTMTTTQGSNEVTGKKIEAVITAKDVQSPFAQKG